MPVKKPRHARAASEAEKAFLKILDGENVDQLLASLSKHERKIFDHLVAEIRKGGESKYLTELWKYDYLRSPPTISEFVEDPYWLGSVTQPTDENVGLWPTWKEILKTDFDLDSRINNCVITGSLGIGKTTIAVLIILYRLALASLLRNPHNFLGLQTGSKIIYVLLSVTMSQVKDTAMGMALNNMALSPYFVEELGFNPDSKYSGNIVDLSRNIQLNGGSKGQHILGRNTPGILLDEGNFRLEAHPDAKAYKLFHEVRTRLKNRFQKTAGFLPAISIIASSASDESSFTETVITEINKKGDPTTEKVYSRPVYFMKNGKIWSKLGMDAELVRQHANTYKDRWFKVAYGLKSVAPSLLTGWYKEDGIPVGNILHESAPTGSRTELVPEDYLSEYERDTIGSLQALSGISIGGSYRLFTSLVDIEWGIQEGERLGVVNPATVPLISLSEENNKEIWDFLDHPKFLTRQSNVVGPKRHSGELRYAHIDHATRTVAGVAICHRVGYKEVADNVDRATGKVFAEQRILVEYDFILAITAGRVKPISFEKIQKFFIWLRDRCGYQFGLITSDTYQSFQQLQMLETRGFKTNTLSLDRTKGPYYSWRAGWEERRIYSYRHQKMVDEAEKLIDGPKMVDHPITGDVKSGEIGTKDVSDAAAGAFYDCVSAQGPESSSDLGVIPVITGSYEPPKEDPSFVIEMPPFRRVPRRFDSK